MVIVWSWNFRTTQRPNGVVVVWSWSLSGPVTPGCNGLQWVGANETHFDQPWSIHCNGLANRAAPIFSLVWLAQHCFALHLPLPNRLTTYTTDTKLSLCQRRYNIDNLAGPRVSATDKVSNYRSYKCADARVKSVYLCICFIQTTRTTNIHHSRYIPFLWLVFTLEKYRVKLSRHNVNLRLTHDLPPYIKCLRNTLLSGLQLTPLFCLHVAVSDLKQGIF